MTNWNNGAARGFGAADDEWSRNGSVGRVNLLNFNLKRLEEEGQVVAGLGHLGDERRGDAGRPRDRDGAAARQAAARHRRPHRRWRSRCSTC